MHVLAHAIGTVMSDLRYGLRQLQTRPGFAAVAVLTLALGIGATTAIFSAVNPILFKALPYPHADRLMAIWESRGDGSQLVPSFGTFHGLSERNRSFESLAVMKPWQPTMVGGDQPERFEGQRVSAEYFRALGIAPRIGRDFTADDDQYRGPNVVILSDRLWRQRFSTDNAIVGREVRLDDKLYTVIGVMPSSFDNVLTPEAELWAPLQYNPALPADGREWGHHLRMIGRLRNGVSADAAREELSAILPELSRIYPQGYESSGGVPRAMLVNNLQSDLASGVKPVLLAVIGAVLLVLLIACVNVTNLLLSRGAQRRGEFAVRVALGAGRGRLILQLLTESMLIAAIGGASGLVISKAGVRALVALSPPELPRVSAIHFDLSVFGFTLGLTALVGLMVGLVPAIGASRRDPQQGLARLSRYSAEGHHTTRRTLVVAEVALALVLLVSAGLLLHSLARVFAIDPGFQAAHLLTMQVQETGRRFNDDAARARFFEQALDTVRAVPGVMSAAFTSQLPLSGDLETYGMEFEAFPGRNFEPAFRYAVSPDYFATMHIPLRRGRLLNEADRAGAPVVVLLSESLANRKFGDRDPIGQRVRIGPDAGHADKPWATVVGVVGNVRQLSLALTDSDAFYTTTSQWAWVDTAQSLVVRTKGNAAALAPTVRNAIWSVDKDQPVLRVATMDKLVASSETERRFALIMFGAFAAVAVVLAAIGIYGVLAGSVTERMREIGVRLALGASPRDILALVLRQGVTLTVVGVVIGLTAAAVASRALISLLFGISHLDPLTYVGVIALLLGVSIVACAVPAVRASRVDPAITLRAE